MKSLILLASLVAMSASAHAQTYDNRVRHDNPYEAQERALSRERARFESAMDRAEKCAESGYTQYCW